jgi:hypothetical protein
VQRPLISTHNHPLSLRRSGPRRVELQIAEQSAPTHSTAGAQRSERTKLQSEQVNELFAKIRRINDTSAKGVSDGASLSG